jgi:hypothetical protein
MKPTIIWAGILASNAVIGSFTWIPPTMDSVREYANEPSTKLISELTVVIAQAKQWDIRTDELTEDVRDLKNNIKSLEKAVADHPDMPPKYRRILELQIESDMKKLNQKGGALDRATAIDQQILSTLQGQTSS